MPMSPLRKTLLGPIAAVVLIVGSMAGLASATPVLVSQPLANENGWRPAWGLDRIDQREAVLNDTYSYSLTGAGVTVYIFDSGINAAHEEFQGRVDPGFSIINDGRGTEDCSGHGTHSASLIGGKTYGVAKQVRIIPVRVLNCTNSNPSSATLYTAIDWIIEHHQPGVPAIVNMSVGMSRSVAFNDAARKLIADGLIVVGAAGNQGRDACLYSPASEPSVIAVGGTQPGELRATQSNFGSCVDLFAPGWDLVAGWVGSTSAYRSTSGTSNAAPIVSGIAALMLQENPRLTQAQVEERLKSTATPGALSNIGSNSSNLLAFSPYAIGNTSPVTTVAAETTSTSTTTQVSATTVSPVTTTTPTTTVVPATNLAPTVSTIPAYLNCSKAASRTSIGGVPYVCVNTGNQLMWVLKKYSPGLP
jgi:subtilisin family serine protease